MVPKFLFTAGFKLLSLELCVKLGLKLLSLYVGVKLLTLPNYVLLDLLFFDGHLALELNLLLLLLHLHTLLFHLHLSLSLLHLRVRLLHLLLEGLPNGL